MDSTTATGEGNEDYTGNQSNVASSSCAPVMEERDGYDSLNGGRSGGVDKGVEEGAGSSSSACMFHSLEEITEQISPLGNNNHQQETTISFKKDGTNNKYNGLALMTWPESLPLKLLGS